MNLKTWVPLVLAIVLGLFAMIFAKNYMDKKNPSVNSENAMKVVVLKKDVPAGKQLTAEDLGTAKMAGDVNPQSVFSDPAQLEKRVIVAPSIKGTPIVQTMLAPEGTGNGMQALIPDGKRAITVEINEFSGVAGNLVPGCRVDIVSTFSGEHGEMLSRTIVQNVRVQALGMHQGDAAGNEPTGPTRSITLIATPAEAEAIELATATGHPRMVLRASGDNEPSDSEGITVAELRHGIASKGDFAQQIELAPTSQPSRESIRSHTRQIKIIRGGVESSTTVEELAVPVGPKWITGANTEELPSGNRQ
ncbi:MAG TPA: Flp pilus assembly protein CpaB [Tepidisphaeraceae bacterium]|nr:Flp pilus assembly protein CpaB [Tepidisphaeraceae bacterium]